MSPLLPSACSLLLSWEEIREFTPLPVSFVLGDVIFWDTHLSSRNRFFPLINSRFTYPRPHFHFVNLVQGVLVAPKKVAIDVVHSQQGCLLCFWVITVQFSINQTWAMMIRVAAPELSKAKDQDKGPHGCPREALEGGQVPGSFGEHPGVLLGKVDRWRSWGLYLSVGASRGIA